MPCEIQLVTGERIVLEGTVDQVLQQLNGPAGLRPVIRQDDAQKLYVSPRHIVSLQPQLQTSNWETIA